MYHVADGFTSVVLPPPTSTAAPNQRHRSNVTADTSHRFATNPRPTIHDAMKTFAGFGRPGLVSEI
ncbi:hypothetical protein TcasGA2_TC033236 [Tribolium castaneum]|uniref:Uncharacterized protein n=1 Tax=Tribolium castaneum TaxID=7070 RepID=A0A139WHD8_TRICA|nr:hypothetical protein TcasGA2_TC033236 [Tribolium castaneum]